jgi:sec-independent protein translocase protein TatB
VLGINGSEFLILLVLAVVLVGPERLPQYAEQLGRMVRDLRGYLATAKERVSQETGVDWEQLDPRQYDPRRIVRDALAEPAPTQPRASGPTVPDGPAPYDDEAT